MSDFERGHLSYISPPETKSIARDWLGNDLYEGDYVYHITESNGKVVLVIEGELQDYIESQFGSAQQI